MIGTQAIEKLRATLRLRHMSLATEQAYVGWLGHYIDFLKSCRPDEAPARKMERFLSGLAHRGVAASTQNQAFNALLFWYRECLQVDLGKVDSLRARQPAMIRTAPEVDEVRSLLREVSDVHGYPTRLIVQMLYGCGMRVSEPLNLRIKDVRIAESQFILRGAKGGKDRVVPIPCSLIQPIRDQLRAARLVWEADVRSRVPVALPGLLKVKYPAWQFSLSWAWVFPSHQPCQDPRSGETVPWRCHEANVQRAVRDASRRIGVAVVPHQLRHAYATHALRSGANIRDLQDALGHAHLDTTAGYITPRACSVPSPLETLAP